MITGRRTSARSPLRRTHDDLRSTLRPLLDLPVERVLVSHGDPILSGGQHALAAVLD
jgi:hypothetical protein